MVNRAKALCIGLLSIAVWECIACRQEKKNNTFPNIADSSIVHGRALAQVYCQSCHMLPDPSLADAKTWSNAILPLMGPRLGIFNYNYTRYHSYIYDRNVPRGFYPRKPVLSPNDWQRIIDYYSATSPDSLPPQQRNQVIEKKLPFFRLVKPKGNFPVPATSFVKIDSVNNKPSVITADATQRSLSIYYGRLEKIDTLHVQGPVVDLIHRQDTGWLACDIGVFNPNNGKFGKLISISIGDSGKMVDNHAVWDSLERPVRITESDLNGDGKRDYLVCEYGNLLGALSWLENKGDGKFERHVLKYDPGAISTVVNDYNHDGLPDIWCLFAQGDERIILFTNQGNGKFRQDLLLRFPPIYGSSHFELDDFNKDGSPDILYTCGDNADGSDVLKPYHGIYIFLNDGKNHFTQKYFFPINGCYKAMAADFDGDGNLDIASIAFFPDFARQPEESFVLLLNQGGLRFKPYSFPEAGQGRWLTMDVGDADGDGKPDILLGNFSIAPGFIKEHADWKIQPPFFLLKNIHS
jgi:hypothetical protein